MGQTADSRPGSSAHIPHHAHPASMPRPLLQRAKALAPEPEAPHDLRRMPTNPPSLAQVREGPQTPPRLQLRRSCQDNVMSGRTREQSSSQTWYLARSSISQTCRRLISHEETPKNRFQTNVPLDAATSHKQYRNSPTCRRCIQPASLHRTARQTHEQRLTRRMKRQTRKQALWPSRQ